LGFSWLNLFYNNQTVIGVNRNNRCLFSDPNKTHKYTVWAERRLLNVKLMVYIVTTGITSLNLGCKHQTLDAVWRNKRCLFCDPHKTLKYTLCAERGIIEYYIDGTYSGMYSDHWPLEN
jgi:hypothetical protein